VPTTTSEPLDRLLDDAVRGRPDALRSLLARGSHLPGTRMNSALADAFAQACRIRGAQSDPVALALVRLSADEAPGATALEFLPVCGVYALAARAAADEPVRARFVAELHARADDRRFRVRDAVVDGLARVGRAGGDALVREASSWMDGYFHAAAVLRALAHDAWLGTLRDVDGIVARLDDAFALVEGAPRAAARWPGHKELCVALGEAPVAFAARFGVPVFDLLVRRAAGLDPVTRQAIERVLQSQKLAGRFRPELARVRRALDASSPPARNPDHDVGPTRDRSRTRRRSRA
jgi:hypothetical protein